MSLKFSTPAALDSTTDEGLTAQLVKSVLAGFDASAASGAEVRLIESGGFTGSADVSSGLVGITTNSRLATFDEALANFRIWSGNALSAVSGTVLTTRFAAYVNSFMVGEDTTGASVLRPVEARNATSEGDFAGALIGLLTQSRCASFDGTDWVRNLARPANTALDQTLDYQLIRAAVSGIDPGAAGGSEVVAVGAETGVDQILDTVVGLVTDSRLYAADGSSSVRTITLSADAAEIISGRALTDVNALYIAAITTGVDTTGVDVFEPVEARAPTAEADFAEALVGLLTQARTASFDGTDWVRDLARPANTAIDQTLDYGLVRAALSAIDSLAGAGTELVAIETVQPAAGAADGVALGTTPMRESGFAATINARRFIATHQTPGTDITGQTSFVATTPTFMMQQVASTRRIPLRSITLGQTGTVAGGPIRIIGILDTADRLDSGGTAVVPQNVNEESAVASALTAFLTNPTANAAGGGTRVVLDITVAASLGTTTQINFKDEVFMGTTSSFLLYTFAAATGPSWSFVFDWEEVT